MSEVYQFHFRGRRGTAADLASLNGVPLVGEVCIESDTGNVKYGDGVTTFNALPYFAGSTAGTGVISVAWGSITGTLSAQTDLATALSGKVATSVTVNGHALTGNITLTAANVGADAAGSASAAQAVAVQRSNHTGSQLASTISDFSAAADLRVPAATHAAASKATPVDTDEVPLADSASSWSLKRLTWANIKATLKAYFDTLYAPIGGGGGGGIAAGTSFPGSPTNDQLFQRTDLNHLCFYDSTLGVWLTLQEFPMSLGQKTTNVAVSTVEASGPTHASYQKYLTTWEALTYVGSPSSGSAYWTCNLQCYNANETTNHLTGVSFSTGTTPDTAGNWIQHTVVVNQLLNTLGRNPRVYNVKTGSPGGLYFNSILWFRLVIP